MIIALTAAPPDYRELLLMTHRLCRVAVCCLHICVDSGGATARFVFWFYYFGTTSKDGSGAVI